jgi:S-adenosylmethionine hydrolase
MGRIITLTTDFGTTDGYAASLKGVIATICHEAHVLDITHEIEPQNIRQAAIVLAISAPYFPAETIHVAVVDPGVGTARQILAVNGGGQIFIAPDNGILGVIFERFPDHTAYSVQNKALFLERVSRTFHGRDIMAPVAAHLASGVPIEEVGPVTDQYVRGIFPHAKITENSLIGQIIYRDRFGNLFTNISYEELLKLGCKEYRIRAGYTRIDKLSQSYSDVQKGELLCLIGSGGYLEIALREGSAADKLRFPLGTEVEVTGYEPE